MRNFPILPLLTILLGAINLLWLWRTNEQRRQKLRNAGAQTTGIVIALNETPNRGDDAALFVPIIRFFTALGEEINLASKRKFYAGKLSIGQEVIVLYSPDRIEEAEVLLSTDYADFIKSSLVFVAITLAGFVLLYLQLFVFAR